MEKIIKINIQNEGDLLEKYNNDIVNHNLIEYIINHALNTPRNYKIKIIIINECSTNIKILEKIKEGLKKEYDNIIKDHQRKNFLEFLLLLLGITFLFLSSLVSEEFLWKEVLLIGGWVPIWELFDIELFRDFKSRKVKRTIEKLITSEIVIE